MIDQDKHSRRIFFSSAVLGAFGLSLSPFNTSFARQSKKKNFLYEPKLGFAKLDSNENPYGPSPKALEAINKASKRGAYYVKASGKFLREMIAEKHNLSPDHVMLSSGSTAVLANIAFAAIKEGHILAPDLFWDITAKTASEVGKFELKRLPSNKNHQIDLDTMDKALSEDVSLIQITNPNNPTGLIVESKKLYEFCKRASKKSLILIDEAYNELTDNPDTSTMIPLVREGENIIITRTFSKIHGLAGMRIGYSIANPEILRKIRRFGIIGDWTTNQTGIAAAIASYDDNAFLAYSKSKIIEAREMVMDALKENGLNALPSWTNFIFVNLGNRDADKFKIGMAKRNIAIQGSYDKHIHWSRVSMGKIRDVQRYINAMPAVLDEIS